MSLPAPLTRPHGQWTANPEVTLSTSLGSLRIELLPQFAPSTVANWLGYVNADYFNGLIFHRVIDGFMVQGGGFNADLVQQAPLYPALALESNNGLSNVLGTLAMARTDVPNSATSQFFINDVNNARLDYSGVSNLGYAVFGQVASGLEVVQAISAVAKTTEKGYENVPVTDVVILDASQTVAGAVRSGTGVIDLTLQSGATWSYSLDSGAQWSVGSGIQLDLAAGSYTPGQVQVRQTLGGVTSAAVLLPAITVVEGAPRVNISAQDLLLGRNETTQISFTLSQASTDFTQADVTVLGAELVNFQGSGRQYTATLMPAVSAGREVVVQVLPGRFTNAQGVGNLDSGIDAARLTLTADAQPPLAPLLLAQGIWLQNPQASLHLRPSGTVTVELLPEAAPLQVANWLAYVQAHAYTYTLVQPNAGASVATMGLYGGPFTTQYQTSLFPGVPQESNNGLSNTFGSLAALYNNSSTTKTTTNGFFVNLANNTSLDYSSASSTGYTVFAHTVSGAAAWHSLAATSNDTLVDLATVEQTVAGTLRLPTAQISVAGLSTGAHWQFSLDSGLSWAQGSGNSLQLPAGVYQAHQVQVQVQGSDAVSNSPTLSTLPHQMLVGVQATHWAKGTALSAVMVSQSASGYKVSAPAPADPTHAISLSDVLVALKIYLNKPLGNASLRPYQTVAADLDANGKVDLNDVLNLLKFYLKKPLSTDLSPQWTFVDAQNEHLSTSGKPIDPANAAAAPIDWQQTDLAPVQLIGVLRGDVDGSFSG
jgi:peptidyl-prolyl cis-trans isomerase A (cyclophilin A)